MFFLRFTSDPALDIKHGCSLWVDWDLDDPDERPSPNHIWVDDFECWCAQHSGLSGHAIEAETMADAIAEIEAGRWFGNVKTDSWAIFEGDFAPKQDTPEGHTFTPLSVVYFRQIGGLSL